MQNERNILLMLQYYHAAMPERQSEIDQCLRENLQNPYVTKIHVLTERSIDFSNFLPTEKIQQTVIGDRLTYAQAFAYAKDVDPVGEYVWILSNADIYFDDSIHHLRNVEFCNIVYALSRHDILPDGTIQSSPPEIAHGSQDCWIFTTTVDFGKMSSDFCLGIPSCDQKVAYEFIRAGCMVLNPSQLIIAKHLDLARGLDLEERVRQYMAITNEQGFENGTAASPPYQTFLRPTDRLHIDSFELYKENLALLEDLFKTDERLAYLLIEKKALECALHDHEEMLKNMRNSQSWKITAPLRKILGFLNKVINNLNLGKSAMN